MKLLFEKLNENAVLPTKAHSTDAGFDLTAVSRYVFGTIIYYGTGVSVAIPDGYVGLIFPRSSIVKMAVRLANSVGVIDSGYRGEIKVVFDRKGDILYRKGDRIAQLVILKLEEFTPEFVDKLSDSDRGDGGFGSSGV